MNTQKVQLFREKVGNPYSNYQVVKEVDYSLRFQNYKLFLKEQKEYSDKLSKWGLLHLYPALIKVMETNPKPNFRDILRETGNKVTSFGNSRTKLRRLGVIEYNGRVMVKGKNWDRFINDKWDWFDLSHNHNVVITK